MKQKTKTVQALQKRNSEGGKDLPELQEKAGNAKMADSFNC